MARLPTEKMDVSKSAFQVQMGNACIDMQKNEKEAIKLHRQLLSQREQGILLTSPSRRQSLHQHLQEWLEMKRHDVKPHTLFNIKSCINCHIDPLLGHIKSQDLTASHIQRFYSSLLQKGKSPNTIRVIHCYLKRALDTAVKWKKLNENPCTDVELPRRLKPQNHYYTVQEVEQLLEATQGHFLFEGLMTLALATGMRCGELLALTWDDIDFQKGLVRVNKSVSRDKRDDETLYLRPVSPKTENSVRELHIADSVLTILQNHRNLQIETQLKTKNWQKNNLVFCTRTGTYIWLGNLHARFKRLLQRADLPEYLTFHDLRHTVGTHLIQLRIPPNAVQKQLGYSDVRITLAIYAHATPEMEYEVAETLENTFRFEKQALVARQR